MNDQFYSHSDPDSQSDAQPSSDSPETPGKKPNAGWFQKGKSANPEGRPRGTGSRASRSSPFEVLLDKLVPITIGNKTREISLEEALQQRTFKDALAGKGMAIRQVLNWIRIREDWFSKNRPKPVQRIEPPKHSPDPDNADAILVLLGIAAPNPERADDPYFERAQLLLEPWGVEAALARKRVAANLTERDRNDVRRCTRDGDTLL